MEIETSRREKSIHVKIKMKKDRNSSELSDYTRVGGLSNLGNTCFFNAVLQCLAQTPYLVKVLEDLREPGVKFCLPGGRNRVSSDSEDEEPEKPDFPSIEGTLDGWGGFTSKLWDTLTVLQNPKTTQTYNPSELLRECRKRSSKCMDGGQHDSHELLRHLLELVRTEDLRRYQTVILKEMGLDDKTKRENADAYSLACIKFHGNQVNARLLGPDPVFRGVLVSTIECIDCHHTSQRTEPFLDLSLPVMADKPRPPAHKRRTKDSNSDVPSSFYLKSTPTPSKHQLKKEKKAARKNRKQKNRRNALSNAEESPSNEAPEDPENADEGQSAEDSDADIEDNVEAEPVTSEVGESGYSSEKNPEASPTEAEAVNGTKASFSEADTDECRSSPELEKSNSELKNPVNVVNGVEEATVELSNLSVSPKSTSDIASPRYVTEEGECSVQSCLNQFTALELMTGSNKVGCKACTAREAKSNGETVKKSTKMVCTPSTKQYLIAEVPAVLILHLKRFQSVRLRGFRKVSDHVKFPLMLDLAPVCKDHRKPKWYSLYGLVQHSGTLHGGHYVAYVKSRKPLEPSDPRWAFLPKKPEVQSEEVKSDDEPVVADENGDSETMPETPPGEWYYVSDTSVVKIDEATVLQKEAYILFYERLR